MTQVARLRAHVPALLVAVMMATGGLPVAAISGATSDRARASSAQIEVPGSAGPSDVAGTSGPVGGFVVEPGQEVSLSCTGFVTLNYRFPINFGCDGRVGTGFGIGQYDSCMGGQLCGNDVGALYFRVGGGAWKNWYYDFGKVLGEGALEFGVKSCDANATYPNGCYPYMTNAFTVTVTGATQIPDDAEPLVVREAGDDADADPGDGSCDTGTDDDDSTEQCTLRAAIEESNARQGAGQGAQSITFGIPGDGAPRIAPQTALPAVEGTTTIDGSTQPGGRVQLDGLLEGSDASALHVPTGLELSGSGSQVRGMEIASFKVGIVLAGSGSHTVAGNRVIRNEHAGVQSESSNNIVGAAEAACGEQCNVFLDNGTFAEAHQSYEETGGNVIVTAGGGTTVSGNSFGWDPFAPSVLHKAPVGVYVAAGAQALIGPGNVIGSRTGIAVGGNASIVGNRIGIGPGGERLADWTEFSYSTLAQAGVWVMPTGVATIGGMEAGDANVISRWGPDPHGDYDPTGDDAEQPVGKGLAGIFVEGRGTVIRNNRIGTDADGSTAMGNWRGVILGSEDLEARLDLGATVEDNLISGNDIGIASADTTARIAGNRIGTDAPGIVAIPNGLGIRSAGLVGGPRATGDTTCTSPCNLVSGNSRAGIASLALAGNFIGTRLDGTSPLPNKVGVSGFWDQPDAGAERMIVGGRSHATEGICDLSCNLIAFNGAGVAPVFRPIAMRGPAQISGNVIRDNAFSGVLLDAFAGGSEIGGESALDGNLITHNGETGVAILGGLRDVTVARNVITDNAGEGVLVARDFSDPAAVTIRSNSISGNGGLGIDLSIAPLSGLPDGPTPNDSYQDFDTGPNGLQNKPVDGKALRFDGLLQVLGNFERPAEGLFETYTIELFANDACDIWGFGEGGRPIALVTNIGLDGFWEALIPAASTPAFITATISHPHGDTSEFGPCWPVHRATRTSASSDAGDSTLEVASTDGFPVGDQVAIEPDSATEEVHTIAGYGSLILAEPLAFHHAVGSVVVNLGPPPDTAITAGPADGSTTTETSATFDFSSMGAVEATFECALDGAAWAACAAPLTLTGLQPGSHVFVVRSTLADGRYDPTPATRGWTVEATDLPPETPYQIKQAVVAALSDLLPTGDMIADRRIRLAVERLEASLRSDRWNGEEFLAPQTGGRVFNAERNAVRRLMGSVFLGNIQVAGAIDRLLDADRLLAQNAIELSTDATDTATALARMARADVLIADGKFARAIIAFKRAWRVVR